MMNELKLTVAEPAGYPIHGSKHFLITATTQLEFERNTIGNLGHWHHGSKMLDKYNQSKCVHELMCRTQIQQQFVSGWTPVDGGELPQEWIDLDKASNVSNEKLKRGKCTKFLSEFSQAKFQMTHCKNRKLNNVKGKT